MRKNSGMIILFIVVITAFLSGCGSTGRTDAYDQIPWSITIPDLSVRLIVRDTRLELGRYPACVMEVMNTSRRTILLRRDFSLNGPAVYNKRGELTPQRRHLEIKAGEVLLYHRLEPGRQISIKSKPNYRMDYRGEYMLRFSIHPAWWGFEDPERPGKVLKKPEKGGSPAVSNEVTVIVY